MDIKGLVELRVKRKMNEERVPYSHDSGAEFVRRNVLTVVYAAELLGDKTVKNKALHQYNVYYKTLGYTGNAYDLCTAFERENKKDKELFENFSKRPEVQGLGIVTGENMAQYLRDNYPNEINHRMDMSMFDYSYSSLNKYRDWDVSAICGVFGITRRTGEISTSKLRDCCLAFDAKDPIDTTDKVIYFRHTDNGKWKLVEMGRANN